AEGGKLCLPSAQVAPWDENRVLQYVKWTKEWLADAACGTLLKVGDPYELPDFRQHKPNDELLRDVPVFRFDESPESFSVWKDRVGQTGDVSLAICEMAKVIAATNWFAPDKTTIRGASFSPNFLFRAERFSGKWILLPKLNSFRARPPQTYEE